MSLCKYKSDFFVVLAVVWILVQVFKFDSFLTAGIMFLLAFALHKAFCPPT
jgi:hypothetical protein